MWIFDELLSRSWMPATIVSIRGCWIESRQFIAQSGEKDKFLVKDSKDIIYGTTKASKEKQSIGSIKSEIHYNPVGHEHQIGYLEIFLQFIYQTCAAAAMLTYIVFWCLLLPFMTGENFQLTLLIECMHYVNAVFLLLQSALNGMTFPWFGLIYFVPWSCYIVFHWVLHACCFTGGHILSLNFHLHGHLRGIWDWLWFTFPAMHYMYWL